MKVKRMDGCIEIVDHYFDDLIFLHEERINCAIYYRVGIQLPRANGCVQSRNLL